jgi:hypothetical protein
MIDAGLETQSHLSHDGRIELDVYPATWVAEYIQTFESSWT